MNIPLKLRLILAFIGVAFAAIVSIVVYTNIDSNRQLNYYMTHGGQFGVENMVITLEDFYQTNQSWAGVETVFSTGIMGKGMGGNVRGIMSQFALADMDGKIIWSESTYSVGDKLGQENLKNAIMLIGDNKQTTGFLVVEGVNSIQASEISPFVEKLRTAVLWAGGIASLVALFLAIVTANQLLKPIRDLTKATSVLSSGNLSTRVNVTGKDEIATLGTAFNHMAESLEVAEERKKALTADVAHELRTPIAVQKAQIEAMMDGVLPLNNENLSTIADQTNFLSRMVDDLRILALADAGELLLEMQPIVLSEWLPKIVENFRPQAEVNHATITLDINQNVIGSTVSIDTDRLYQILLNLLSNAMRYGKIEGVIDVALNIKQERLCIAVHDHGPGIPAESIPHLFERFYRDDRARSRDTGGTGLGLSIAKKLAQLMGGDVTGGNHPAGGALFEVYLPAICSTKA
ncbi:MAG: hypothetical protein C0401_10050 [Anaerolinea sp.]|nr:hypothetical protein [Anaerolinea sp.]